MLLESRCGQWRRDRDTARGAAQVGSRSGTDWRRALWRVVLDLATVLCSGSTRCCERLGLDPGWTRAVSGCGGESRTAASLLRVERTLSASRSVGKQSDVVGEDDRARVEVWERRQLAAAQDLRMRPGSQCYSCASRRHMDMELISAVAAITVLRAVQVDKCCPET
jgi:hypothetical protein